MIIDQDLQPAHLTASLVRMFALASDKIERLDHSWNAGQGAPVITVEGKYTARGWTEWTQGFHYGCALLTFDATGNCELLELGRERTVKQMAPHVTHTGVHDHAFNNLSTFAAARPTKRSSIATTATSAADPPSKAIRPLAPGRAGWPGQCSATRRNWSFSKASTPKNLKSPSIYHRPNGWDYIPPGHKVPCGESSMWGDYHLLELGVFLERIIQRKPYLTFFDA